METRSLYNLVLNAVSVSQPTSHGLGIISGEEGLRLKEPEVVEGLWTHSIYDFMKKNTLSQ